MEIYSTEHKDIILEKGKYSGFPYIIRTLGLWPCAYIGLVNKPDFDVDDLEVPIIFTYKSWETSRMEFMDENWEWLGWDYGHCCDYVPKFNETGQKHTIDEIREHVKEVIKAYRQKIVQDIFDKGLVDKSSY